MTVPDSFGGWENEQGRRYIHLVEEHLLPMEDRLAELKDKLKRGVLTDEEDMLIDLMQDAIANGHEERFELEDISSKVERARGME